MHTKKPLALAFSLALLITVTSACGGAGSEKSSSAMAPTPTLIPTSVPLSAEDVLNQSGDLMGSLSSFRFEMTHEVGTTQFMPGINAEDTLGDISIPDKLYAEFSGVFGEFPFNAKLIVIDNSQYMTNPITGNWEQMDPTVSPVSFFKPQEGITAILRDVTSAEFLKSETGIYRLSGRMPATSMESLMGTVVEDGIVDVEIEIDAETMHLKMVRFMGQIMPSDQPDTVRIITLSRFNEPITIVAPEIP